MEQLRGVRVRLGGRWTVARSGRRVDAGTTDIAALIVADPERSAVRPIAQRWSATQYAAHVRDVLNTLRDRLVIGLVEDDPSFNADVSRRAGRPRPLRRRPGRCGRRRAAVGDGDVHPPVRRHRSATARPTGAVRRPVADASASLLWMGQQAVHEVEHHRGDIVENLAQP